MENPHMPSYKGSYLTEERIFSVHQFSLHLPNKFLLAFLLCAKFLKEQISGLHRQS
jgi:hypothetical protein